VHRMYHGTGATNTSLRLVKYVRRKSRRAPFTLAGMTLLAIQAFMLAALAQNEAWRKDSNDNNRYQVSNEGTFIKDGRRAEPGGAGLFQHKDSMVGSGKSEGVAPWRVERCRTRWNKVGRRAATITERVELNGRGLTAEAS
jgi:hypothetical protein